MNNEEQDLLKDALGKVLTDMCTAQVVDAAESGRWPGELWQALTDMGLTLAGISEQAGGTGGNIKDSLLVIHEAAKFAAPVPLAEHFLAARLLEEASLSVNRSVMSVANGDFSLSHQGQLVGQAEGVAFGRWAEKVILLASRDGQEFVCRVDPSDVKMSHGSNLAGEPLDSLEVDQILPETEFAKAPAGASKRLFLMGAALRSLMMAGALESSLQMSVQYAMERSQFGRPISKFQAIQHQLADLAGESAASTMAAHAVASAFDPLKETDIAIGKARIGEAVSICTDIAHQVHGAMGYTMEHSLNHRTRRLWSWRDDYGSERFWQKQVGQAFLGTDADALWSTITNMG